ncbi:DUF2254 domain-containing protein [Marinobacter sp.]|uniref:DUF2254 domain-containing protein n=1 Tax=Marinobacter sp. TaxID=50741 RepID=UPI0038513893
MSRGSGATLGLHSRARFLMARLRERLWFKPLISCALSLVAAFVAGLADHVETAQSFPDISSESIEALLSITSASMLVIAVFAVGAMVSAYASASSAATPHSFPLVLADDVSQNALSTFIGAFIFSIVALVAILNGYYDQAGRFVLFVITIFVFAMVILGFVRWVDRIARLGRMGNTIEKVEAATDAALKMQAQRPTLGAVNADAAGHGTAIYPETVGYVQNIDVEKLQRLAEKNDGTISVCALPGAFVTPGSPLAYFEEQGPQDKDGLRKTIVEAFEIASQRSFESDPCFGLSVLSEIASRAMSPAVNDPGTAIDITGSMIRLFVRWAQASEKSDEPPVEYGRIRMPAVSLTRMFDAAFSGIARDGASSVEVAVRLQKAFHSLTLQGHGDMEQAAITHSKLALRYADLSLKLPEEREAVESAAPKSASC